MSSSTTRGIEPLPAEAVRRSRAMRRAGIGLLATFLGLGAANVFGVRSEVVVGTGGGYSLEVVYAAMTRPGLATPWAVRVTRAGGFDGPVTIATTAEYFDLFDENGLDPDPSAATSDEENVIWEFDPPPGDTLEVTFDARLAPAIQVGKRATTSVLVEDVPVVSVSYSTGVMP